MKAKAAMNLKTLSSLVFSATLFLALSQGRADPGYVPPLAAPAAPPVPDLPDNPLLAPPPAHSELTLEEAEILQRYDRNGDGRLDETERVAAHMTATKSPIGGRIGQVVYTRLLATFDHDHRGYLTPEEQAQAIVYLRLERPILYQALLRRFDRDHTGDLDSAETAKLFGALQRLASRQGKGAKQ